MLKYGECHYPPEYITKFLLKKYTYKKWNKMGPLCVLKFFESNLLQKKKKYEKGCEEEK